MIVDDDRMSRKAMENLCSKTDLIEVRAVCETAEEGLRVLGEMEIDLIFLDIELPGITGIDFLDQAAYLPQIIFTTSKKEYAYEAFEYQVTDFLKKPITLPRFLKAVEKAVDFKRKWDVYRTQNSDLYIKEEGKYIRIDYEDILYFENVGDYVRIKTTTGTHVIHSTLKSIDEKLNDPRFLKVHRSYIVNLKKIKDIEENTLVIEKAVIPISRANKPVLMSRINIL